MATRRGPRDPPPGTPALPRLADRTDPFASVWPCVRAWLEAEPDRVGKELFARLQGELLGVFSDGQLRTFQRRVKEWRRAAARQLVFASPSEDAA